MKMRTDLPTCTCTTDVVEIMTRQEAATFSTLRLNRLTLFALHRQVFFRIPSNRIWQLVIYTWDVILRVITGISVSSIWWDTSDLNVLDFQHQFSEDD